MGAGVDEDVVAGSGSVVRGPWSAVSYPRVPATSISLLLLLDMAARFYAPDLNPSQQVARLPADEAHHLVKVLRLAPGAIVGVFDGRGNEWRARVETAGRDGVEVSLLEPVPARRPAVDITLVQAVLKGEPMDDVVRDCTMVGVAAIQPVLDGADYRQDISRADGPGAMAASRARISQAMRRCQAARDRRRHYASRRGSPPRRFHPHSCWSSHRWPSAAVTLRAAGVAADTAQRDVDGRP